MAHHTDQTWFIPYAEQICKDCGRKGCLIPVPHPNRCGRAQTPEGRAPGMACTRALGHDGPCAMDWHNGT